MLTLWPPGPLEQNVSMRRSFVVDLDVHFLGFRQHRDRRRRRVDAAARLGRRHALHAVHAALVLQLAVDAACLRSIAMTSLQAADAGVAASTSPRGASPAARRSVLYIRNSSPANSAASSPPVPARISRMTFFSSFGSFGMSRIFSSREQRVAPGRQRTSALPARARACRRRRRATSSSVCAMSSRDGLVLAEALDERLDLGKRLGVLPVLRT